MDRADRAFWAATAVSLLAFAFLGPLERRIGLIGEDDLSTIWAGPRAVLLGLDPYDPPTWVSTAVALGTQLPDTAVYGYPPWVALALLPLGAVPLPIVSMAWLVGGLGLSIATLRWALRALLPDRPLEHALAALALLVSWAGLLNAILGQWGGLLIAALFALVFALRRDRVVIAGLLTVALLAKPQLFLLAAPALAIHACWPDHGRWPKRAGLRYVAIASGAGAALIAIAWMRFPGWWAAWSEHVAGARLRPDSDTIPSLLGALFGPVGLTLAPLAIVGLLGAGLAFHPRSSAWVPVWLAISVTGAPYTNSYDKILLIVPLVLAAGALRREWPDRSRAVLLGGASVLLFLTPLMYVMALARRSEALSPVVPLMILVVLVWGLWPLRRWPTTRPGRVREDDQGERR